MSPDASDHTRREYKKFYSWLYEHKETNTSYIVQNVASNMSESKQLFAKELEKHDANLNYRMLFPTVKGHNICMCKSISITAEHKTCTYVLRKSSLPVVVHVTPEETSRKNAGRVEEERPNIGDSGMKYFNMCVSSKAFKSGVLMTTDLYVSTIAVLAKSRSAAETLCTRFLEQAQHKDIKIVSLVSPSHEGWVTMYEYATQRVLGGVSMNNNKFKELPIHYDGIKNNFEHTPEPRAPKAATPGKATAKKPRKDYTHMNRTSQRQMWKSLFRRHVMNAERIRTADVPDSVEKKALNKESVKKEMKDTAKMQRWITVMMYKMMFDKSNTDKRNVYYEKFTKWDSADYIQASAEFRRVMVPKLAEGGGITVPKPKKQVKVSGFNASPYLGVVGAEHDTDVEERYRV